MTILTKVFLGLSVLGFVAGCVVDFSSVSLNPMLTVLLPLGAVFFGLFLISLMLEKEMAVFDEEASGRMSKAEAKSVVQAPQPPAHGQLKERTI